MFPFVTKIIQEIAEDCQVKIYPESEFSFVGEIIFVNGKREVFNNAYFNVNPAAAVEISKDKHYTKYFLAKHFLPVPAGQSFFSPEYLALIEKKYQRGINELYQYIAENQLPIYLKANNLSQGKNVFKVYQAEQIAEVIAAIFAKSPVLLAEIPYSGNDYRLIVFEQQVHIAYQRNAFSIIGDGCSSIITLIENAEKQLRCNRPNIHIPMEAINIKLNEQQRTFNDVLAPGKSLQLLDQANLSCGGSAIDSSQSVHSTFQEAAIKAANVLGLQLCGVDIIAEDITKAANEQNWVILELNAAPGLDNYYSLGEQQQQRVLQLYRRILQNLAKR